VLAGEGTGDSQVVPSPPLRWIELKCLIQQGSRAELAQLGVARVSYGFLLHHDAMERFSRALAPLAAERRQLDES
jgi:hypothetical protein